MSIEQILSSFRQRNAVWSKTMRTILHVCGLQSFRGWSDTVGKLQTQIDEGKDYAQQIEVLNNLYLEHLLIGEKAVKVFVIAQLG